MTTPAPLSNPSTEWEDAHRYAPPAELRVTPPPPEPGSFAPNAPTEQILQRVMSRRYQAAGFDRDMQIGAVLLAVAFFILPIVFGSAAVYFGYRSHRAGNPMGPIFAIGAGVATLAFIAVVNLGVL